MSYLGIKIPSRTQVPDARYRRATNSTALRTIAATARLSRLSRPPLRFSVPPPSHTVCPARPSVQRACPTSKAGQDSAAADTGWAASQPRHRYSYPALSRAPKSAAHPNRPARTVCPLGQAAQVCPPSPSPFLAQFPLPVSPRRILEPYHNLTKLPVPTSRNSSTRSRPLSPPVP